MSAANAEKIIKQIKELPPLPLVVQRLLSIVDDGTSSAKDVTRVLASDQALAAKVLKLVNSSFYGFSKEISTITRAVVILGFSAVRNLAIGLSAADVLKHARGDIDWDGFWSHGLASAAGAQALAKRTGYPEPEEAFIAGLLHDIGHFVMSITLPEEYGELLKDTDGNLLELETERMGMTHCEVGIRLLEHWKLPQPLCRTARFHHSLKMASPDKDPLVWLVTMADALACIRGDRYVERVSAEQFATLAMARESGLKHCGEVLEEVDKYISDAREFLHIRRDHHGHTTAIRKRSPLHHCVSAVVSSDSERFSWVAAALSYHGCKISNVKELCKEAEPGMGVRLAIFDAKGVLGDPASRLAEMLEANGVHVAVLEYSHEAEVPELENYPRLDLVLTRDQLEKCLAAKA